MFGNVAIATEEPYFYGSKVVRREPALRDGRSRAAGTVREGRIAFVEMASDDEAQTAIRELNASQVGGRSLTVNEARPKAARSGGDFGGGSNRRRSEPRW